MAAELMKVLVAGKGPVRKYVCVREALLPHGTTMSMLVSSLHIPRELRVVCMMEGKRMPPAAKLHDGDSVILVSMLPGG